MRKRQLGSKSFSVPAREFFCSSVTRLWIELRASGHTEDATGVFTLFTNDIFEQLRKWLNGHIAQLEIGRRYVEQCEMYLMMAVVLLSDLSGIILDKAFDALSRHDFVMPKVDRVSFIINNLLGFSSTGKGNVGDDVWLCAERPYTAVYFFLHTCVLHDTYKISISFVPDRHN